MIKRLKYNVLLAFILIVSGNYSFAQLNGSYSIGDTSGYPTFSAAINDLDTFGVNGPVIFNIFPGTYPEQLTIYPVFGISATNTITFQSLNGDSSSVILQFSPVYASSDIWTLRLYGADYISFKKITIKSLGFEAARVIELAGGASNNKFLNNRLIGRIDSLFYQLVYSDLSNNSNCEFRNNLFKYGINGIELSGTANPYEGGTVIESNNFENQIFNAIKLDYQNAPIVKSNIISATGQSLNSAIQLSNCYNKIRVEKNIISTDGCVSGININSTSTTGNEGIIANNMVLIQDGIGINLNSAIYNKVYHNTVKIKGNNSGSSAIKVNSSSNTILKNNILVNKANGYAIYINGSSNNSADYNCFYSNGSNLANYNNSAKSNLTAWQSASSLDPNSITKQPNFYSSIDLHLLSTGNDVIKNGGIVLSDVTDDIDEDIRNFSNPDIGADEFLFLNLGNDTSFCSGGSIILDAGAGYSYYRWQDNSNTQTHAASVSGTYWVEIKDTRGVSLFDTIIVTIDPVPVANFSIDDSTQCLNGNDFNFNNSSTISFGTLTYNWNFGDGANDTSMNVSHNYGTADSFEVTLIVSASGCSDTITKNIYLLASPSADFSINDSMQCLKGNVFNFFDSSTISFGNLSYNWNFGDGNSSTDTNSFHNYTWADTFEVTLIVSSSGCEDTLTKNVYLLPSPQAVFSINDTDQCLNTNNFLFTDSSFITSGDFDSYWEFGDSATDSGKIVSHTYLTTDSFKVTLLVISQLGCNDASLKTVYVNSAPIVILDPLPSYQQVFFGDTISLKVKADLDSVNFEWHKDGGIVANEHDSIVTIYNINDGDTGNYFCRIWNNCGDDTSNIASIVFSLFGQISGSVFNDNIIADCNRQLGENGVSGRRVKIMPGYHYTTTDSNGNFQILLESNNYKIELVQEPGKYANWSNHTCVDSYNISVVQGYKYENNHFATRMKPDLLDLDINIIPNSGFQSQRGYDNNFTIQYNNFGSEMINNGVVELTYDSQLTFISASINPIINGNKLSWSYSNLSSNESRSIFVVLNNPVGLEIGDTLLHSVIITPVLDDSNVNNNYDTLRQTVVSSVDPNDKQSYPVGDVTHGLGKIEYIVRFQNVGTAPARRVTVIDTLDMTLLQKAAEFVLIKGASHPYELAINNNVFKWTFENIMLPDSFTDEPGSHGSLRFSVGITPDIAVGTEIKNRAYIYFDYESPLRTNVVINKVVELPNNIETYPDRYRSDNYKLYPVPAKDVLFIENKTNNTDIVSIYNAVGKLMKNLSIGPFETISTNIKNLPNGAYFVVSKSLNNRQVFIIAH